MIVCYYSFYGETMCRSEPFERISKIGMVLYVNHAEGTFVFHENAPEGKYPDEADAWVHMRTNTHTLAFREKLLKHYKEIEHTCDPHPWSLPDEEKY